MSSILLRSRLASQLSKRGRRLLSSDVAPKQPFAAAETLASDPTPPPRAAASKRKPWGFLKYSLLAALTGGTAAVGYVSYAYTLQEIDEKTKALREESARIEIPDDASVVECVEHMVDFKMNKDENGGNTDIDHYKINAREYFIPTQDNWILLTADYSQIELRVMAHFSKDSSLIELLSKPHGDVFTMIAARWTGLSEDCISSDVRDQTKRLVYGILYGMGANSLAEQLDCSPQEASEKIQNFKSSFPGIASWLHEAVAYCRKKGYVETLKGRKRFLSKIKFGNSKEKSKAQRQAVNSICQGSAADIIKIAMINIYSVIVDRNERPETSSSLATKFHLKGRCRILLQVHDELVLEVDPSVIKEAALLLQTSMENAVSLLVPLHVKLKVGRTWGSLQPFQANQYEDLPSVD